MITSLRLENFRRHAKTEIRLDEQDQLILISGDNGVGKTTLLEAIMFALYGESRHGKRHLDRLVRRGAELEGMEVECTFLHDGTEYRVLRRRDNRNTSALLYGNGIAQTEGTDAVTAALTRLFGMDAAGFRLAVVAQQKQLDGLASLRGNERAVMLARLLRLDVINKARDRARAAYRLSSEVLRTLGPGDDIESLRHDLKKVTLEVKSLEKARKVPETKEVELRGQLEALADVGHAWREASLALANAQGVQRASQEEVARLEAGLASVVIPDEVIIEVTSLELRASQTVLADRVARGEANARLAAQRDMLVREVADIDAALADIDAQLGEEIDDTALLSERAEMSSELDAARDREQQLRSDVAVVDAEILRLQSARDEATTLGARCDHCGQDVDDEHREQLRSVREAALVAAVERRDAVYAAHEEAGARVSELEARLREIEGELRRTSTALVARNAQLDQRNSQQRRRVMAEQQIARLGEIELEDLDDLAKQRVDLAAHLSRALAQEKAADERERAIVRKNDLETALSDARLRLARSEQAVEDAAPSADLVHDHEQLVVVEEALEGVRARLAQFDTQLAGARERVNAHQQRLADAEKRRDERSLRENEAVLAANTADVLDVLSSTMTTRVRPLLEGAVGELLATLSDGRFSEVKLDEDYAISVVDDGKLRPLSDFSGGEIDLIALAMRLALASVIGERQGHSPGFLILDEVFGSQDATRRLAITTALRNLRHVYGQVFLISHVGGLEEEADVVIELTRQLDASDDAEPASVAVEMQ